MPDTCETQCAFNAFWGSISHHQQQRHFHREFTWRRQRLARTAGLQESATYHENVPPIVCFKEASKRRPPSTGYWSSRHVSDWYYQCISVPFPVQAMLSSTYCVPHSVQIPNPYKRLVTHVVELERRFKEESGPWAAGISASIRDAMLGSMHCSSYYEGKTFHCYSCNQGRVVLKKVQRGIHGLVQESTTYHGIMIKGTQCSFKEMVFKGRNKNHLQR